MSARKLRASPETMADLAAEIGADFGRWLYYCVGVAFGALLVSAGSTPRRAYITAAVMFCGVALTSAWRYAWVYYRLGARLRVWWALRRLG